ncbi:uncharacterized protein LOC123719930 isoform X1 [Pieris brassicae]|nr:uncharacterized protein LOC123719930 isoform X1 [Pieris brassicae]
MNNRCCPIRRLNRDMWAFITAVSYLVTTADSIHVVSGQKRYNSIFRPESIIFKSNYTITKLLVPADGGSYIDHTDIPTIFFTVYDRNIDGEHCIYVLEDFAAYEILEGGRDSTSDYGLDKTVYFGAKDGVYKYDPDTLSAKKFGEFHDDIIQIQKANGTDLIYFLTSQYKLYKLENNGTKKTKVNSILCALEFVLDTSNNIYYLSCDDHMPRIVQSDGILQSYLSSVTEDLQSVKFIRPAFIMENGVPFFGDGTLYMLYSNGTTIKKDFYIKETPTAFSIDAALYFVAAIDGKIYEFNVMEVLLRNMFGVSLQWPSDLTKIIMSVIDTTKEASH